MTDKLSKEYFERVISNMQNITLEQLAKMTLRTPAYIESWCKDNYDGHTFGEIKQAFWGDTALQVAESLNMSAIQKGNIIGQIFLAKNYLGMTDKVETKLDVEPITFTNDISDEED